MHLYEGVKKRKDFLTYINSLTYCIYQKLCLSLQCKNKTNVMSMENKKKLKAQLINEVRKEYSNKIENLTKENGRLKEENQRLKEEHCQLSERILELSNELEQYKDWNERMQEFVNMSDEERNETIENIRKTKETSERFTSMFGFYGHIMKHLF